MPPLPTLVCKQCGYVNEGERVYCHGCGAKLDRDVIAAVEKPPSLEAKRREVKRIMSPRRGMLRREGKSFNRMLLAAVLTAALVCAVHAPEDAVALDGKRELMETPPLYEMVERVILSPVAQRGAIAQKDLNAYLHNERFRKVPPWVMRIFAFQRVYVTMEEGTARLTVGGSFFGYPVYAGWKGCFRTGSGGLEAVCTGGFVGRLSISSRLASLTLPALPMVVSSAERDWRLFQRLQSVEFSNGKAILTTRSAPVAPPAAARTPVSGAVKPFGQPVNRPAPSSPLQGGLR